jgi:hypothetical protein
MGWLASTIKNENKTRAQRYIDAGADLPFVDLECGGYLIDIVNQIGPVRSNGMGLDIPDWKELVAFSEANDIDLEPWEYRLIRSMCRAYLSGLNSGKEALSIPPIERGKEDSET